MLQVNAVLGTKKVFERNDKKCAMLEIAYTVTQRGRGKAVWGLHPYGEQHIYLKNKKNRVNGDLSLPLLKLDLPHEIQ